MKKIWKHIDDFLLKLSNWILVAFIVVVLYFLSYKRIIGEQKMYEDYYDKSVKSEQSE
jgi:hypothetical protein